MAEHAEGELDDEQEDTAAGRETEDLWHEALVQRRGALLADYRHQPVHIELRVNTSILGFRLGSHARGVSPVVFWDDAWDLARSLYARLHDL